MKSYERRVASRRAISIRSPQLEICFYTPVISFSSLLSYLFKIIRQSGLLGKIIAVVRCFRFTISTWWTVLYYFEWNIHGTIVPLRMSILLFATLKTGTWTTRLLKVYSFAKLLRWLDVYFVTLHEESATCAHILFSFITRTIVRRKFYFRSAVMRRIMDNWLNSLDINNIYEWLSSSMYWRDVHVTRVNDDNRSRRDREFASLWWASCHWDAGRSFKFSVNLRTLKAPLVINKIKIKYDKSVCEKPKNRI